MFEPVARYLHIRRCSVCQRSELCLDRLPLFARQDERSFDLDNKDLEVIGRFEIDEAVYQRLSS